MDGTIYLDGKLFPGTMPFLEKVEKIGGKCLYLTNNSSKSAIKYQEKLAGMGIDAPLDAFVTSVQATAKFLNTEYPRRRTYVCGTEALKKELAECGICVTDCYSEDVEVLLCGFDTELTFKKLDDCARLLSTKDIPFIATNPDWVCPTSYGYVPDCGSFCEMLTRATGKRPRFIGKPQPDMVYMALEKTGCRPEEALLIGDRLYTDIACALNADIDSAFVLSGEGMLEDIETTGIRPSYIFNHIGELADALSEESI